MKMQDTIRLPLRAVRQGLFWFAMGAILYPSIEICYRGYTHYAMAIAGGLCAVLLFAYNRLYTQHPRLLRAVCGAGLICLVEFIFGVICNLFLGWAIWDYSALRFHIMGQISLRYFLIWCVFSFLLTLLFDRMAADEQAQQKNFQTSA